jgi:pimeloyl-ACP methyl ester carboxylesterase
MSTIYRSPAGELELLRLYDRSRERLGVGIEDLMLRTRFGHTHLLVAGPENAPPVIVFQGGNVVSPVSLSWFLPLADEYRLYAPDTIGHPGRSAQVRLSPRDASFGEWTRDLLDGLGLERAAFVGPSYGGGIVLRMAAHAPERISRAALVVPSGLGSGSLYRMLREVAAPMLLYRLAPSRERLERAVRPLYAGEPDRIDEEVMEQVGAVFRHVRLETKFPKPATRAELSGFTAPTLVLAAEHDLFFPPERVIPHAREVIPNLAAAEALDGCGHLPSADCTRRIREKIRAFLAETR